MHQYLHQWLLSVWYIYHWNCHPYCQLGPAKKNCQFTCICLCYVWKNCTHGSPVCTKHELNTWLFPLSHIVSPSAAETLGPCSPRISPGVATCSYVMLLSWPIYKNNSCQWLYICHLLKCHWNSQDIIKKAVAVINMCCGLLTCSSDLSSTIIPLFGVGLESPLFSCSSGICSWCIVLAPFMFCVSFSSFLCKKYHSFS